MKNISKSRFLAYFNCPRNTWELCRELVEPFDPEDHALRFRMDQGHIVGALATKWFDEEILARFNRPQGINIDIALTELGITRDNETEWLTTAVSLTRQALDDPNVWAIYEATFHVNGFTTRADILADARIASRLSQRPNQKWKMIEVKSKTVDITSLPSYELNNLRSEYVPDMAYTVMVSQAAGIDIIKAGLMLLDKSYYYDGIKDTSLFHILWHFSEDVKATLSEWQAHGIAELIKNAILGPPPPRTPFFGHGNIVSQIKECRSCHNPKEPRQLIFNIPRIGGLKKQYQCLVEAGHVELEKIPSDFFSHGSTIQRNAGIVIETVKRNKIYLGDSILSDLASPNIVWPVLYLDFETLNTAIPLYSYTYPYEVVPFQYSLQRTDPVTTITGIPSQILIPEPPSEAKHREFIADPALDERIKLAEQLLHDIHDLTDPNSPNSSIMVYNETAEKGAINYLASLFNDERREQLLHLNTRLVDLYKIVQGSSSDTGFGFYHPNLKGKLTLKDLARVCLPQNPYEHLDITKGDLAAASYGELAYIERFGQFLPWPKEKIRTLLASKRNLIRSLLFYCGTDTATTAMIHAYLTLSIQQSIVNPRNYLCFGEIPYKEGTPAVRQPTLCQGIK